MPSLAMAFQASSINIIFRMPFQFAHLGNKYFHNDEGNHRK